jgi:hypothetical protein
MFGVAAGANANGGDGYRADPGFIWVRHPGCYGLQVDGRTFTRHIYLQLLAPHRV